MQDAKEADSKMLVDVFHRNVSEHPDAVREAMFSICGSAKAGEFLFEVIQLFLAEGVEKGSVGRPEEFWLNRLGETRREQLVTLEELEKRDLVWLNIGTLSDGSQGKFARPFLPQIRKALFARNLQLPIALPPTPIEPNNLPRAPKKAGAAITNAVAGYVYLLRAGPFYQVSAGEFFKIGKAQRLKQRLKQIELQLPFPIVELAAIKTPNCEATEKFWHHRFFNKRRNGEWFELTADDVAEFLMEAAKSGVKLSDLL